MPVVYTDSSAPGGSFVPWHTAGRTVQFAPVARDAIYFKLVLHVLMTCVIVWCGCTDGTNRGMLFRVFVPHDTAHAGGSTSKENEMAAPVLLAQSQDSSQTSPC